MKKLLTSLSLLCLSLPAYCEEVEQYVCTQYGLKDALETIWIILIIMNVIFGILTLGLIFMRRK